MALLLADDQRADFDQRGVREHPDPLLGDTQRGVQILHIDDGVAADRFLSLDEGSIHDHGLAVLAADRRRLLRSLQLGPFLDDTLLLLLSPPLAEARIPLLHLVLRHVLVHLAVRIAKQEHVLHVAKPPRSALSSAVFSNTTNGAGRIRQRPGRRLALRLFALAGFQLLDLCLGALAIGLAHLLAFLLAEALLGLLWCARRLFAGLVLGCPLVVHARHGGKPRAAGNAHSIDRPRLHFPLLWRAAAAS